MTEPGSADLSHVRDQFIAAQLAGDRRKALELINDDPGSRQVSPSAVRVPTDHLLTFIAKAEPDLIVLSATLALHADAVREAVRRIRELTGDRVPIAVGGQICEWVTALAAELAVPISGCDADALVEDAGRLLGLTR